MKKKREKKRIIARGILFAVSIGLILIGIVFIWLASVTLPDISSFSERKVVRSTKIFDRTGEIVLHDVHDSIKRTIIPASEMGSSIKNATVAIEDDHFYEHRGIRPSSFLRAAIVNLASGSFSQGGSTITQQVVKNSLLTQEKRVERKLKEWVLALKLEQQLTKDEILGIYLNETPYGGNVYGIAEAARRFYGKEPADLTLTEAAYLAAIPKAPTYYSPYGTHTDELERRKNTVLRRMYDLAFITEEEYQEAREEKVTFLAQVGAGIQAPHFVFFVLDQLREMYGESFIESEGLRVYTTLDHDLQVEAERIVEEHALRNEEEWNAENAGLVSIDPKSGEILVMVGSRNYFDENIDGKFNVSLARRQPGSSFKPFAYATAFKKGYIPDSVVFDLRTQFTDRCDAFSFTNEGDCYAPRNYDDQFIGPVSFRNALAQSRNVPSVKVLYLAGIANSLRTAKDMGITTLTNVARYGLTLVLGGGEVRLLDMVSAYGVFAADGIRREPTAILKIENDQGETVYEHTPRERRVLDSRVARLVNDILSDNEARAPLFGSRSFMYFEGRDVAGKTGTTNNNRDAWMIGYSPTLVTGVWSGNNDNTPMERGSGISGGLWGEFMRFALPRFSNEAFPSPIEESPPEKPILAGDWQGGEVVVIDSISGKLATEFTPNETKENLTITNVHSILHWVDRDDPTGPIPEDPDKSDQQYDNWDPIVERWWNQNSSQYNIITAADIPTTYDDVHTESTQPSVSISSIDDGTVYEEGDSVLVSVFYDGTFPMRRMDVFVNNQYIGTTQNSPFNYLFSIGDVTSISPSSTNTVRVVVYDSVYNSTESSVTFEIKN